MNQYAELKQSQQDSQRPKDTADPAHPHSYEWYVIENINDPDKRIDHILPLDEAIPLYAGLDCEDKRLGVTKDEIAAVDLVIRWNGREWLSEDRLKLDSFKDDPVVADACARLQQMLETAQAAAMLAGSMFGWACPGADPANYDGQGRPIKPRTQSGEE